MTEKEIAQVDRLIERLAMDASALEWEREKELLADVTFEPSLRYRLSMRAMVKNPLRWYRNRRRSVGQRVAQMAASVVLALIVLFATVLTVSPTARATVRNWLMEWYEYYMEYHFTDEAAQGDPADYELSFVPEGYFEMDRLEVPTRKIVHYCNDKRELLKFECQVMERGNMTSLWTDSLRVKNVEIQECCGEIHLSGDNTISNNLIWRDTKLNLQFSLYGFVDEETLIAMAESVKTH